MKRAPLCVVCALRPPYGSLLCKPCGVSYDRALERDNTIAGALEWAANRARRFERRRARADKGGARG